MDQITFVDHQRDLTEPYPEGADQEQAAPQAASTSSKDTPEPKSEMVVMLSRMHYELSKLAKNAGVTDICATEKANRLENVIAALTSKDLVCKFCKKKVQLHHIAEKSSESQASAENSTLLCTMQKVFCRSFFFADPQQEA